MMARRLAVVLLCCWSRIAGAQGEPPAFSARTGERLQLGTGEQVYYVLAGAAWGAGLAGFFAALESDNPHDHSGTPTATPRLSTPLLAGLGGAAYLGLAVASLKGADRGDLPLALGIVSLVPAVALLGDMAVTPDGSSQRRGVVLASASVAALPLAYLAARNLDLDPGDTELVRDATFWGMVLGAAIPDDFRAQTTGTAATITLMGLAGGTAVGLVLASQTELSLERVRLTSWGGCAGFGAGLLTGGDLRRRAAVGAVVGLAAMFLLTTGMDRIPEGAEIAGALSRVSPGILAVADGRGRIVPALGIAGALP